MEFKIIQPPQQLADFVRFFWFAEYDASTDKPFVHHAFAYPYPELIFCYKGKFNYSFELEAAKTLASGIYGQTATFSKIASITDFGILGVYLYPHAFPQLFCLPASELTNQHADIKSIFGHPGEILEEKIMLAVNNNQRLKLVCDFLIARLKNVQTGYRNIISSINLIKNSHQLTSVNSLAQNNYLSVRQFERRFKEFSGFTPKLFLRIARFNSVLNNPFKSKSLTQLAHECGYYDQAHFNHDFKKFSGHIPKEYFREETIAATDRGTVEFEK
jgi:AraC-like DNA-binding protein